MDGVKIRDLLLGRSMGGGTGTASGAVASFVMPKAKPLSGLAVAIVPAQSGSGDPSPSNIRPITGFTGANIKHSGADTSDYTTIPVSWASEAGTFYGGTLDVTTGLLTAEWEMASGKWGEIKEGNPNAGTGYYSASIYFTHRIIPSHAQSEYGVNAITNCTATVLWKGADFTPQHFYTSGSDQYSVVWFAGDYDDDLVVQCLARLAVPVTFPISAVEITAQAGQNYVWADAGDVTVKYPTGGGTKDLLLLRALAGRDK